MAKNQFENVIKKFDEFSYYVDGKIARGIEENRKGQFALVFKDKNGKLLENFAATNSISAQIFSTSTTIRQESFASFTRKNSKTFLITASFRFIGTLLNPKRASRDFPPTAKRYSDVLPLTMRLASAAKTASE